METTLLYTIIERNKQYVFFLFFLIELKQYNIIYQKMNNHWNISLFWNLSSHCRRNLRLKSFFLRHFLWQDVATASVYLAQTKSPFVSNLTTSSLTAHVASPACFSNKIDTRIRECDKFRSFSRLYMTADTILLRPVLSWTSSSAAADTILLQTVLSSTSSSAAPMAPMSDFTQSIHLCFGLPLLLLSGGAISSVRLPTQSCSRLYMPKPPQSRFRAPVCDLLYLLNI